MRYEVNEKKYFKIEDIVKINDFKYELKHLETTFDLEKFSLEIEVDYIDSFLKTIHKTIILPIELNTTMTEQLTAQVNNLEINIVKNNGINLDLTLEIEVTEIADDKEIIKDNYQQSLEEKLQEREIEVQVEKEDTVDNAETKNIIDSISEEIFTLSNNLKTEYAKYKILSLEDSSLDKISAKYNLAMDFLYDAKKSKNKVIVYVKE